jgi:hypothetical protein
MVTLRSLFCYERAAILIWYPAVVCPQLIFTFYMRRFCARSAMSVICDRSWRQKCYNVHSHTLKQNATRQLLRSFSRSARPVMIRIDDCILDATDTTHFCNHE